MTKIEEPITLNDVMRQRVYGAIEKYEDQEQWLTRIGASGIGEECFRAIFYGWRGYTHKKFDGRILRLFETGHQQEERIVQDLIRAGYEVWAVDNQGKQFVFIDDTGHAVAKIDGVIRGVPGHEDEPLLLEIKTHNDKSFKDLNKKQVEKSKRFHYWQTQMGMKFANLNGGLYVSVNKNDEDYYFEYVPKDEKVWERIDAVISRVVTADIIPVGVSDKQDEYWGCRFCDHIDVCTGKAEPEVHCRTCVNSRAVENGEWLCTKLGVLLNREDQKKGCGEYEVRK